MNISKMERPFIATERPGDSNEHAWLRKWRRRWNTANSEFWGSPKVVEKRTFFACPATVRDCDGCEWRTDINVTLGLADQTGSGFAERVMDAFANLGGCIDIKELRRLCRRIGKGPMASHQWLAIEFVCPALPTESAQQTDSGTWVSYLVCKGRRSIRQCFKASVPTRCQYAAGDRCTHDQCVDVEIALETSKPVAVAALSTVVARIASCSIYGLLKLDEALEPPVECTGKERYIQNAAEEIYGCIRARALVKGVYVRCESAETVHNYHGTGQVSDIDWSHNNINLH